eukprot:1161414-Pelagomonas_calceolata.AAC.6
MPASLMVGGYGVGLHCTALVLQPKVAAVWDTTWRSVLKNSGGLSALVTTDKDEVGLLGRRKEKRGKGGTGNGWIAGEQQLRTSQLNSEIGRPRV